MIIINDYAKKAWEYYVASGMTPEGCAGLMGNQYYESDGFVAHRVEYLCLQKLRENGKNYTQDTYYKAVDSGEISRSEFLNPLKNKVYGFGLSQWTTPNPRKAELYDRTVAVGKSIADEEAQLEYTVYELKNRYPSIWKILTTTNSIQTASDTVLRDYESPSNWQTQSTTRLSFAKDYYNYFTTNATKGSDNVATTKDQEIDKLISIAKAEVGYLEKASNSQLDDKTANAGYGNFTKYWRDVYPAYQGLAYCACFVSWCFMKAFGLDAAKKLLKHWPYVYCPTMANLFKLNANPKVGDIVIFYRGGTFAHTGIVIAVNGDQFTTIEGNTSNGSSIIPNGGAVCMKSYYNSQLPGTKFCTPDWSIVANVEVTKTTASKVTTKTTTTTTTSGALNETPKWTGVVTTGLNVRRWAGTEYGLCSFSPLKEGTEVGVCDTVKATTGADWYFIKYQDKFGFASAKYIKKKETTATTTTTASKINVDGFLAALTKMNAQMQKDLANGKKWGYYNSKVSGTFAEAVANGNRRCNCATLPNWALKMIGVMDENAASFYGKKGGEIAWRKSATKAAVEKYCEVIKIGNKTVNKAMKDGTLKKGDIVTYVSMNHTNVYLGGERWFDSGHAYAHGSGDGAWWETWFGETHYGGEKIGYIIRLRTPVSYRVQVGSYLIKDNANNMMAKVKAAGFAAEIITINNQYIVQVGGSLFQTLTEANALAARLDKAKFPTAVIEIKG